MSDRVVVFESRSRLVDAAFMGGMGVFGFIAGQFIRLPGLEVVCDNALPFSALCILISVGLCTWSQLKMSRSIRELRVLGDDLSEISNRSDRSSGASG